MITAPSSVYHIRLTGMCTHASLEARMLFFFFFPQAVQKDKKYLEQLQVQL